MKDYNILITIPARGGSKGVPGKALKDLGGMPLIAYTIRDALAVEGARVFVNTDDSEIARVSEGFGAESPRLRPAELACDDSSLEDGYLWGLDMYREREGFVPDIEIVMSPTHPFRRENLLKDALETGVNDEKIFNIGSVAPVSVRLDNFWEMDKNGVIERFHIDKPCRALGGLCQSAFSFNIVFSCRRNLPNQKIPVFLNEIEAIDIDEPDDLEVARLVVENGLYPFN